MKKYKFLVGALICLAIGLTLVISGMHSPDKLNLSNALGLLFILLTCVLSFLFFTTYLNPKDCKNAIQGLGNGKLRK